jgi:Polyketide cyclase / dehydrase and lipid transport
LLNSRGGFVISELLNVCEPQRWFSYRILKTNLPMTHYVGEMWVEPGKAGGSVVQWQAHLQRLANAGPKEDDAATLGLVQAVFKQGLDNLAVINK